MTEVASLKVRVDSLEARLAGKDLDNLARKGDGAAKATAGLARAMARFAGPAAIAAGAVAGFSKMVSVQREFDVINAGLVTATGSAEGAAQAFKALQQFATETPYSLQQVSEAFVKLQNYGLDPSERALTSYGNTAAALGKDLMQMVEAVADATTGEFERLKEFGIKARKEGDQIRFTFRGVTETVRNEATAIEEYLIRLGENNFAGNMEARMATLDGAMSNLGDEWNKLWLNLSQSGAGDLVADGIRKIIDVLEELNDYLDSGQFEGHMEALGASFGPWVDDAKEAFNIVQNAVSDFSNWLADTFPEGMKILTDAWQDFPENIRAIIQIAASHVAWFVESVRIAAGEIGDYWRAIKDGWGGATLKDARDAARAALERNNAVLDETIDLILKERDATDAAADAKAREAQVRRDLYDLGKIAAAAEGGDQLAGFRRRREGPSGSTGSDQKARETAERAAERARQQREREFQAVVDSLRTEEEKIRDSYNRRKAIILASTAEASDEQARLLGRLDEELRQQEQALAESQARRVQAAREGLMSEEQELEGYFARRRAMILENIKNPEEQAALLAKLQLQKDTERAFLAVKEAEDRDRMLQTRETELQLVRAHIEAEIAELKLAQDRKLISEEEYLRRRDELINKYNQSAMDVERRMWQERLAIGEEMFGSLAELARSYGGEQSKAFKAMFALQKAFTIASAALDIQKTISDAMAKGWPQNIPLIAQAIAQGARIMSAIRGINYSGAYDSGGWIPAGSIGLVAERGDEIVNGHLVRGPAKVISRKDTQELMSGGGDTYVSITVNMQGGEVSTNVSSSGQNVESAKQLGGLIELKVRDVLIREKRPGGLLYTSKVA